tara:strand:- start:256 stop:438 length:183 start_codon:yes stop_codon:yes gene_type:complete
MADKECTCGLTTSPDGKCMNLHNDLCDVDQNNQPFADKIAFLKNQYADHLDVKWWFEDKS